MRHEPPPRDAHRVLPPLLEPCHLATLQALRVAMNALELETTLDPSCIAASKPLQALIAAGRDVVNELGFGDDQPA